MKHTVFVTYRDLEWPDREESFHHVKKIDTRPGWLVLHWDEDDQVGIPADRIENIHIGKEEENAGDS